MIYIQKTYTIKFSSYSSVYGECMFKIMSPRHWKDSLLTQEEGIVGWSKFRILLSRSPRPSVGLSTLGESSQTTRVYTLVRASAWSSQPPETDAMTTQGVNVPGFIFLWVGRSTGARGPWGQLGTFGENPSLGSGIVVNPRWAEWVICRIQGATGSGA